MFYKIRQRLFYTLSRRCRYITGITSIISALFSLIGCTELTKLIPSNQELNVAGLSVIDFTPSMAPVGLLPSLQDRNSVFTLQNELRAASTSFAEIESLQAATSLNNLVALNEKLTLFAQEPELARFLMNIPPPPSAASVEEQTADLVKSAPNLKTSFLNALQNELAAPLVQRFSTRHVFDGEPLGFQLLFPPESFYSSLATSFDPTSATAYEALQDKQRTDTSLGRNHQKVADRETYRVTQSTSLLIYVRSFQPKNAFHGLLECKKINIALNSKNLRLARDANVSLFDLELSYAWPRLLSLETTDSAFGISRINSSNLSAEYRPSLALIHSDSTTTGSESEIADIELLDDSEAEQKVSLDTVPVEYELTMSRTADFVNSRYQENIYDGAGSANGFTLFHEAKKLFLFRFGAAARTPFEVNSIWTSFQIPYGKLIIENKEMRNEFGLNKSDFSEAQKEFLTRDESLDGISTAPKDKWSNTTAIQFYRNDRKRYSPQISPETQQGGLHFINRTQLAQKFSTYFPVMNWRKNAAESAILKEEDISALTTFCKRAIEAQ